MFKQSIQEQVTKRIQMHRKKRESQMNIHQKDAKLNAVIQKLKKKIQGRKQQFEKQNKKDNTTFSAIRRVWNFLRGKKEDQQSGEAAKFYEAYSRSIEQLQYFRKMDQEQWDDLNKRFEQQNDVKWQMDKINTWAKYLNSYTSAQAQNSSVNVNVKAIYLRIIAVISTTFMTQQAQVLSEYLRLNLKYQYPQLNSYQIQKKAIQIYQSNQAYDTLLLYNQLKTDTDNLNLTNLEVIQRPPYLYGWAQCFVINTAVLSPVQMITNIQIDGENVKFMIQYEFDFETRNISNCKLTLGQTTVDYFINKTDVLWVLSQKLFQTKMQYEQKTIK